MTGSTRPNVKLLPTKSTSFCANANTTVQSRMTGAVVKVSPESRPPQVPCTATFRPGAAITVNDADCPEMTVSALFGVTVPLAPPSGVTVYSGVNIAATVQSVVTTAVG